MEGGNRDKTTERLLLNHAKTPGFLAPRDSWPPEEKNSTWGQRRGLITQSFCVIKFYYSIKEIEKTSDIGIRSGQKEYPLASVNNKVIYSTECLEAVKTSSDLLP